LKRKLLVSLLLFALIFSSAVSATAAPKTAGKQAKAKTVVSKKLPKKSIKKKTKKVVKKPTAQKKSTRKARVARFKPVSRGRATGAITSPGNAEKLIANAKELIGTPYRSGGTTPAGFDCSGFTQYVFKSVGIDLPRTSEAQASAGIQLTREQLVPGALVYFNTGGSGVSHVGIYLGDDKFIDSSNSKGVAINSLNDKYWGTRYLGATLVK